MSTDCTPAQQGLVLVPRRGQWAMLSSLIFLIAPTVDVISTIGGLRLAGALALVTAFLVVYTRVLVGGWTMDSQVLDDPWSRPGVVALVVLACGLVATGGTDWSGLWCFVAAAAGLRIDRRIALPGLFLLGAAAGASELLRDQSAATAFSLFIVTLGVGMLTAGFRRLRVVNLELGAARDAIGRLAVADERLRFARDLHDLLGHSLSVIALKSELASRLIAEHPDQAAEHVRDIESVSRRALSEVREAVAGYRRPLLSAELAGARSTLAAAGIEVDAAPAPAVELPPDAEAVLAWAIREGATNVLRHSEASNVRISVNVTRRDAELELVDDGCGSTPAGDLAGTGLAGLAERVARVRGRMDAAPGAGGGFRLAVTVPLEGVA